MANLLSQNSVQRGTNISSAGEFNSRGKYQTTWKWIQQTKKIELVPATPGSVSVSQKSVCAVPASPSTGCQDTESPNLASTLHIVTSAEKQQAYNKRVKFINILIVPSFIILTTNTKAE